MNSIPHGIQVAGVAQRMANILAFACPANYRCGGPSYAAQVSIDSILHIMGVGVAVLQNKGHSDSGHISESVKEGAVCGSTMVKSFIQHKAQILGGALHSVAANIRGGGLRECPEVTEEALLMLIEWYLEKTGETMEGLWKKMAAGGHDQLIMLDKTDTQL